MKYCKPKFHFISAANATAHCADGSGASVVHECTAGPGISDTQCNPGGIPANNCNAGTIPGSCAPTGVNVELPCVTGTGPV